MKFPSVLIPWLYVCGFSILFNIPQVLQLKINWKKSLSHDHRPTLSQVSTKRNKNYLADFQVNSRNIGSRNVVINEILSDPTPSQGLPNSEFVEIFNTSDKSLNLKGWQLEDPGKTATFDDIIIQPNEYVILCPKSSEDLFVDFGKVLGLSNWPSLNNSGDLIKLKDTEGLVVDSVNYQVSWFESSKKDGGWSLEQINPFIHCSGETNWGASKNSLGGSPGQENSVFSAVPDNIPPIVSEIEVIDSTQIKIIFNEPIDPSTLLIEHFVISHSIKIQNAPFSQSSNEILLTTNEKLNPGESYQIDITKLKDCQGNQMEAYTDIFGIGAVPGFNDLIISEIMANPSPKIELPEVEYLELYNRTSKIISLQDIGISDYKDTIHLPNSTILPNQYIILCHQSNSRVMQSLGQVIGLNRWLTLNDSGDLINLFQSEYGAIFSIVYSDDWYGDPDKSRGGWSLEMIDSSYPCVEKKNWLASTSVSGGTPGKANSFPSTNPDLIGPILTDAIAVSEYEVWLQFNEKLDAGTINHGTFMITPEVNIDQVHINEFSLKELQLALSDPIKTQTIYEIKIEGLTDCAGNLISSNNPSLEFGLPEIADSSDIVLNEVLFNPRSGGVDFVEIFNRSNKFINLKHWKIANQTIERITNEYLIIPPKHFIVFTEDIKLLKSDYPSSRVESLFQVSELPSLPDDEGKLILIAPSGDTLDRFDYSEDFHFPLIKDQNGVSLERISVDQMTNNANNWHSAASTVGFATPGYQNSQSRQGEALNGTISITPKVFSPDNSGTNDFITIQYQFDNPGYTGSLFIFDSSGRKIKEITANKLLSLNGLFTWDGTDEQNQRASIGYYIVYFEVFNPNGSTQIFKGTAVLATKF
ncbi:lamin tail domain-containing protein [Fulvivirgaceae bacterium BMA10]|uniref:Lamin tail domain-containing protein n=1 Tax=Splendidivirga corallicola TaxID=3051826 RepID=A0ABT8KRC7_9BACT|nr:lamin tail domain-containing protein [Fulvivirgaceae bacterium BMA10]